MPHAVGGRHLGRDTCRSTTAQRADMQPELHQTPLTRTLTRQVAAWAGYQGRGATQLAPQNPTTAGPRKNSPNKAPPATFPRKSSPGAGPSWAQPRKTSPSAAPPAVFSRKSSPSTPQNANFGPLFVRRANFFALTPTIRPSRANFFAHRTQPRGNCETDITTAPESCTKNAQFSPAKAMAVSVPHRHQRAKATMVSDNRVTSPAAPKRGARGRRRGLALEKSHAIRLDEVSIMSENVAIPTV